MLLCAPKRVSAVEGGTLLACKIMHLKSVNLIISCKMKDSGGGEHVWTFPLQPN